MFILIVFPVYCYYFPVVFSIHALLASNVQDICHTYWHFSHRDYVHSQSDHRCLLLRNLSSIQVCDRHCRCNILKQNLVENQKIKLTFTLLFSHVFIINCSNSKLNIIFWFYNKSNNFGLSCFFLFLLLSLASN